MKKQPKIAVYMSCYNHEKFVGQAIECIINQTYPNWELFIVNDASTDNSGAVISSYKDDRIHYYEFKENTKMVGAVNFMLGLIKNGDYDYVQSMASDDYLDEDKFRQQIEFFDMYPQYKVCFTWDKVVFDNGQSYMDGYSHKSNQNRFDWMSYFLKYENCMNANSVMIEKKLFFEMGCVNEYYIQTGDFKMWFDIATKYPFYIIKKELTYYRRHETNLSNVTIDRLIRSANEQIKFIKDIIYPLNKSEFYRAYYGYLPYIGIETDAELWAAKFYLLASMNKSKLDSIALDIYYDNCTDNEFISVLKEKYLFGPQEFYCYSGNGGVGWILDEICNLKLDRNKTTVVSPARLLMELMDNGKFSTKSMRELASTTLIDLYDFTSQYSGGIEQFEKIKEVIKTARDNMWKERDEKNCLFIISAQSAWYPSEEFLRSCNSTNNYITYVNTEEDSMLCKKIDVDKKVIPSNCKYVDLFDSQNMCLTFADTQINNLHKIYYIDCMIPGYECVKMLGGYPLECAQYGMMSREVYEKNNGHFSSSVMIMESINIY